jgi:hypothetical protein
VAPVNQAWLSLILMLLGLGGLWLLLRRLPPAPFNARVHDTRPEEDEEEPAE